MAAMKWCPNCKANRRVVNNNNSSSFWTFSLIGIIIDAYQDKNNGECEECGTLAKYMQRPK
jgi:hypothetical protein